MRVLQDWNTRIGLLLFVLTFSVYAYTTSPSIGFWDCGEFVATAYTMGIPHQPGTPLYVLVGRVFSILLGPVDTAYAVNLMSGFFAALAVVFGYLIGVRLQRQWGEEQSDPTPEWLVHAGAATGALFLAFSHTFWINATEAEVYSIASFTMAFVAYLSLRWYARREFESSSTLMLIIIYLMGLSVGFHLGSILVYSGVFVLALVADRKALPITDLVIVSVAMGAFVLSTMTQNNGPVLFLIGASLAAAVWRWMTWGSRESDGVGYFSLAGIGLFYLGISVHLLMMIRAGQDPMINQSDPSNFDQLMHVLRREQYPPRSVFEREAPLLWQFKHFWGSTIWGPGQSLQGKTTVGYLQQFTFFSQPGFLDRFLPLGFWFYGLFLQMRGNWRMFLGIFTTLFINSVGLILLLNFTDHEVRDRDYFYAGAFQFLAIFIGLGVGGMLRAIWLGVRSTPAWRQIMIAAVAFLLFIPMMPLIFAGAGHRKWYEHNRHDYVLARNYGHNILAGLPQDAIIFTNGDNDTFPLWYLQEVEGFRTDVRVVNLSLINLPWYIQQLRDYEPSLPITWTDDQLFRRGASKKVRYKRWETELVAQELPSGEIAWIRDMTIWHVVQNLRQTNSRREVYYAVTVPNENIGQWHPFLDMEGLVYRLTETRSPDELPTINVEKIWSNFQNVYDLSGVVDENGHRDDRVYRDHNSTHLLKNYPAALARIGYEEAVQKQHRYALDALDMAFKMDPEFHVLADVMPIVLLQSEQPGKALEVARHFLKVLVDPAEMALTLGEALISINEHGHAVSWAEECFAFRPDDPRYSQLLYQTYVLAGREDDAERVLIEWINKTGEPEARQELERLRLRRESGTSSTPGPVPPADDNQP